MSWFSTVADWFSGRSQRSVSRSFDHATFVDVCAKNPQEARAMLAADQYALAKEIERTFEAYDKRLRDLAARVHELTPQEFQREAQTIREAQDGLRRALRRLEVSAKTAKELQQELMLWQTRKDESPLHADHPMFRSEIIESELRARGTLPQKRSLSAPMDCAPTFVKAAPESRPANNALLWLTHEEGSESAASEEVSDLQADRLSMAQVEEHEPLPVPEVEYLLQAIREATREAERWHEVPEITHDEDALLQVHHLRDLHTVLKRLDREQGVYRDRLALAVSPRNLR